MSGRCKTRHAPRPDTVLTEEGPSNELEPTGPKYKFKLGSVVYRNSKIDHKTKSQWQYTVTRRYVDLEHNNTRMYELNLVGYPQAFYRKIDPEENLRVLLGLDRRTRKRQRPVKYLPPQQQPVPPVVKTEENTFAVPMPPPSKYKKVKREPSSAASAPTQKNHNKKRGKKTTKKKTTVVVCDKCDGEYTLTNAGLSRQQAQAMDEWVCGICLGTHQASSSPSNNEDLEEPTRRVVSIKHFIASMGLRFRAAPLDLDSAEEKNKKTGKTKKKQQSLYKIVVAEVSPNAEAWVSKEIPCGSRVLAINGVKLPEYTMGDAMLRRMKTLVENAHASTSHLSMMIIGEVPRRSKQVLIANNDKT